MDCGRDGEWEVVFVAIMVVLEGRRGMEGKGLLFFLQDEMHDCSQRIILSDFDIWCGRRDGCRGNEETPTCSEAAGVDMV